MIENITIVKCKVGMVMKRFLQLYIRFIQRILISVALVIVYFIGFGITALALSLVRRGSLSGQGERRKDSWWIGTVGYDADKEKCLRES
jgi:hypothetical protein